MSGYTSILHKLAFAHYDIGCHIATKQNTCTCLYHSNIFILHKSQMFKIILNIFSFIVFKVDIRYFHKSFDIFQNLNKELSFLLQ